MRVLKKIVNMDNKYLYLVLLASVIIPFLKPFPMPIDVTGSTMDFVNAVENLTSGDRMLMAFDYSVTAGGDVDPQAKAILEHAVSKGVKVVCVAFLADGRQYAASAVASWENKGKLYGQDILNLGYAAGGETAISAFAQDVRGVFPVDVQGQPLDAYPIMEGIDDAGDFAIIVEISTGNPGPAEWIRQVQTRYDVPLAVGVGATMGPQTQPYLQSGQLIGLLSGGLKSAAEYETAIGMPGNATSAMSAQSLGGLLLVALIVLGNILFFVEKTAAKDVEGVRQ